MRTGLVLAGIAVVCLVLLPVAASGQFEESRAAAELKLKSWQKNLSPDQVVKLGFASRGEFRAATLGTPFEVFTVTSDRLMSYEEGSRFAGLIEGTNYVVFPVLANGQNRALVWTVKRGEEWGAVRIGGAKLARDMRSVESRVREESAARDLGEAKPARFVRVYPLYLDFLFLEGAEQEYIVPLEGSAQLELEGSQFYTPDAVVPQWKELLERKLPVVEEEGKEIKEG